MISLKKNQSSLYSRVEELFKQAVVSRHQGFTHTVHREREIVNKLRRLPQPKSIQRQRH
jgi:hypothetical protein